MSNDFRQSALDYHRYPQPGKLAITATKPLANQRDLSLAYSPGVAAACEEIVKDPRNASLYTARANLVGVITNGTAVLGLGDIGPLASKPVMEGKAVLFKKFAGIDVFDIEIKEKDPAKLVDIIAALEPTFGALNLEDIKAPECFYVEEELKKRLKIPVFHDDQHGTAIIVGASVLNGLELVGKKLEDVRVVTSGAGAAALACLRLLVGLGIQKKHIIVTDLDGVVYAGRKESMDPLKATFASNTQARTLAEALEGADVFLGLSAGGVLKPAYLKKMAQNPLILALANPEPEINPTLAKEARPDAIIATGRSDFPNQVNNVLCFPFIFRGALDVGATEINEAMKLAAVRALAQLAKAESSDIVEGAYNTENLKFGPDYIIPKPFDPRLILLIAPAVAQAAMDSGVATHPIPCMETYKQELTRYVYRSGLVMKPLFIKAKADMKRIVYAEGEDERILRALQVVIDEKLAHPIIVGRRDVVQKRLERLGLRLHMDKDFTLVDPQKDERYAQYWQTYHKLTARKGVSIDFAKTIVHTNNTVIAALMVHLGDADGMLCGAVGRYHHHLSHLVNILGLADGVPIPAAMTAVALEKGFFFFTDSYVNPSPTAEELASITLLAAQQMESFGIVPKIAFLSHSNFGTYDTESALKMRRVHALLKQLAPSLEMDGEMHADAALSEDIRRKIVMDGTLTGVANLLVMPTLDAAHITVNTVKMLADGQQIGPLLLGMKSAAHIMTNAATVRGIVNMTAYTATHAQQVVRHCQLPLSFQPKKVTV